MRGNYIIGAGATGIGAALATGWPVMERQSYPGGLSASYTMMGYLFERGGGHWLFGMTPEVARYLGPLKTYVKDAAVFFAREQRCYPGLIQQHIPPEPVPDAPVGTMKEALYARFGSELCERFFYPFNERYTAGLYDRIASQDQYKSPTNTVQYNNEFCYPVDSLGRVFSRLAGTCDVRYGEVTYPSCKEAVISTIPLTYYAERENDPYTSVLVLNIGAVPGSGLPSHHWLYVPDSEAGFYRVGIYSNVDSRFAPPSRCALYVEKSFWGLEQPREQYVRDVIAELQAWNFIKTVDVVDENWVEVAYTWRWPNSTWREDTLLWLEDLGVHSIGRYGRWKFQGIVQSFSEGLSIGERLS
jgi:protoporphyrinogen oxidase